MKTKEVEVFEFHRIQYALLVAQRILIRNTYAQRDGLVNIDGEAQQNRILTKLSTFRWITQAAIYPRAPWCVHDNKTGDAERSGIQRRGIYPDCAGYQEYTGGHCWFVIYCYTLRCGFHYEVYIVDLIIIARF